LNRFTGERDRDSSLASVVRLTGQVQFADISEGCE
jgi:hypothetical protein